MTKILIDLSTIERNKDYAPGCREYVKGPMRVTFTCNGPLPESFVEGENVTVTNWSTEIGIFHSEGLIIGDIDIKALQKEKCDVTLKYERETMEVSSFEDRQWFFKYEPTVVTCTECGSMFKHEYLESDSSEYDSRFSSEVCPVCGNWDCCEIEYEDIKDALIRKVIVEAPTVEEFSQLSKDELEFEKNMIAMINKVKKEDLK